MDTFFSSFANLDSKEQLRVLCDFFTHHLKNFHNIIVPEDFLQLSLFTMQKLQENGKTNVLYNLAKGLGTMRPDQSDSFFPMTRMPFGMLEYMTAFFTSTSGSNVSSLGLLQSSHLSYVLYIISVASNFIYMNSFFIGFLSKRL